MTQPALISQELVPLIESGVSVLVGSRDAELVPEAMRGMGVRVEPGQAEVTVFLPAATAARTLSNLRATRRLAVCCSRARDHRGIQLKGEVISDRPADDADRRFVERYQQSLVESWTQVGVPPRITLRIAHWPCHAVRLRVTSLFVQTPGPGAGEALVAPSR
ncbi:MAG: hypothetical protein PVF43_06875 [Candidatus Eiseniibacteriota bacterium]